MAANITATIAIFFLLDEFFDLGEIVDILYLRKSELKMENMFSKDDFHK